MKIEAWKPMNLERWAPQIHGPQGPKIFELLKLNMFESLPGCTLQIYVSPKPQTLT